MLFILWIVLREHLPEMSFRRRMNKFLGVGPFTDRRQRLESTLEHSDNYSTTPVKLGLAMVFFGMVLFNYGLRFGLEETGVQAGSAVPVLFIHIEDLLDTPYYTFTK
eukprot:TRINITY_DN11473_c0_g1_i1.p1 TRINITY_DN11473_c0_g1~~TRINITY_DN11473_c0_g1_i1.p1  ORF type:complete len:107 (+),score=13.40 TRINITY_DN11473_c0_g1_i1:57-377(+)